MFPTSMMNTAMQEPRRSPRILKQKSCFGLDFKEGNGSETANEDGERAIVHLDAVGQITIKYRNTPLETLLSTITEGEKFLTSVKTKAIAHQRSTAELRAKLQVAETALKESAAAFSEEIAYFKEDVTARDNEIARLRGDADKSSGERNKIAKLVQRNLELESTMEKQSAKLTKLEDWRFQMRRVLSGGDDES
ncbi:hypothetical protein BcDW1_6914 [Botrytis cinerea BcDW1]|uniref:Uncharacterized protein n=1 Tax=Botryotinia fuckeliana (strain BcDW1) TaxID=1290391 RepID=M7TT87_BOTF1|nr:hypothetical protein BcDW1_6914 [Botrytis cinerea BcDW1]